MYHFCRIKDKELPSIGALFVYEIFTIFSEKKYSLGLFVGKHKVELSVPYLGKNESIHGIFFAVKYAVLNLRQNYV